ncbi:flagellar brake protein [Thermanaeromonas sp. C210]|uniref:flagellar brake protein n=1 Tax=Thermanaeromonas sp. C210 TaxID=2731925 RepID=UPI00155C8F73|nr:PilZ domain-containing protein [Thermanaeromonas sp. C210]GFN24130.1 glycosyltransferase-like protein [Thermanaeromonas sp. C210]
MARYPFLRINRKIVITQPDSGRSFTTVIQEVGPEEFAVLAPEVGEVALAVGERVKAVITAPEAKYEFATTLKRQAFDPVYLYYFRYPQEVRRIQQRSFVRAKVALEVQYAPLAEEGQGAEAGALPRPDRKGYTVDLSGGGAQLVLKEKPEPGSLLLLSLPLPDGKAGPLILKGRVRRVVPRMIDGLERYEVGVSFENLAEKDEDRLVKFVFRRLREERRQER